VHVGRITTGCLTCKVKSHFFDKGSGFT